MKRFLSVAFAAPLLLASAVAHAAATTAIFAPAVRFDPMGWLLLGLAALVASAHFAPKAFRGTAAVLAVLVLSSIGCDLAFAADGSAPETVAQATGESNKIVWAWGTTVQQWAGAIFWSIGAALLFLFNRLPANIVALIGNARVLTAINYAIPYAMNAVRGAVAGKTLEVDVANKVLAQALQYVLENANTWLVNWAGGPMGIAKKIWSLLPLPAEASDIQIPEIVDQVTTAVAAQK
jgi:hypothetical protein